MSNVPLFLASILCLSLPGLPEPSPAASGEDLASGFAAPPDGAKPHTWWHWMNGNVTKEGITADLEAMKRVGVGGAQIFSVDCGIPAGPVKFMSPEWRALTRHALAEAYRLGIEICLHNCAGWSSSGGPWNTPAHAMQFVVTAETNAKGPSTFAGVLPKPESRLEYYRDIAVLAFPTPPAEAVRMRDFGLKAATSEPSVDGSKAIDGKGNTSVILPLPEPKKPHHIQLSFNRTFAAGTLVVEPGPGMDGCGGDLQASDDGKTFRTVRPISLPRGANARTFTFPAVEARHFRLVFRSAGTRSKQLAIREIRLSPRVGIDNLEGKAAYVRQDLPSSFASAAGASPDGAVPRERIVDLTARMKPDGRLDWDVPEGDWTVLRIGHTPTGKNNHPAPAEGTGPECDKMSREAVKAHFDGMMQKVIDDAGPLAGRSLNNVLIDSYEVGSQNWTPRLREEFEARRGYELLPFLPVFSGRVVENAAVTERFLWDLRRTIADLFAENYFGYFGELARGRGLQLSVEPYGNGPFDDLQCGVLGDIVMGEFWAGSTGHSSVKLAASAAHTGGRTIVGAESFTARPENGKWLNDPASLKAIGDLMYCAGINRYIFHRYAHQPWMDRFPGMTMGQWGFHFERTVTWWEQSAAWLKYHARCQHLLQSGLFVADALYCSGEGAPATMRAGNPALPEGYDFDGGSASLVMEKLSVRDGRLVLPHGMSYAVLVLPPDTAMTPAFLRKIRDLVKAGATVVATSRPAGAPGLTGYPACDSEVETLAGELWGACDGKTVTENRLGKGRLVWGQPLEQVFASMKLAPDFSFDKSRRSKLACIHRRAGDADIYFVSNQRTFHDEVECAFRVEGRVPEFWNPEDGSVERAPIYSVSNGLTRLPLRLSPAGSVFVVFREPAKDADPVAAVNVVAGDAATPAAAPRLVIRKAVYEAVDGSASMDVTEKLRSRIVDGRLSVVAANETFGRDPAFKVFKQLRVEYTLDGKDGSATVREKATLDVPADFGSNVAPSWNVRFAKGGGLDVTATRPVTLEFKTAGGRVWKASVAAVPAPVDIAGPWELRFPPKRGAPETVTLDRLISWSEHAESGVRYFSGTAVYRKDVDIPAGWMGEGKIIRLDLGAVKNIADVKCNGKDLGVLWKPPFEVDITGAANAGRNEIEIRVTNLWPNRLIGDEQLPDDCEWNGIAIKKWPAWLTEGKPRTSGRLTFTTWKHWTKESALLESGLLGPVKLQPAVRTTAKP